MRLIVPARFQSLSTRLTFSRAAPAMLAMLKAARGDKAQTSPVKRSASGTFKSTRDFMGDVTNFARAHPIYSLLACQDGIATTTNCQLCAATLFKKLTGRAPSGHGVDCKPEGEWAAIARNTSTPTTRA